MCGRFTLRTPPKDLVEIFQLLRTPELAPRYNIAPTQPVAVVRQEEMTAFPVSTLVNNPRNESPQCIEAAT